MKELNMKDTVIWKKEDMIEEFKKDSERLNQLLISKDIENQSLKSSLNSL
jgi:hypothetical protein